MTTTRTIPLPARERRRPLTIADRLFGTRLQQESDLSVTSVVVRLPEGEYPALVRLFISATRRPRWPWTRKTVNAEIQLLRPIPVPGQGPSAVEIDDHAIYTFTCRALTPADAVRELVRTVSGLRAKYLAFGWQPACSQE